MPDIDIKDLLKEPKDEKVFNSIGRASRHNIDKTGRIYHVITKSNDGSVIFHQDSGNYRHSLLCKLCEEIGVTVIFSVTMPNHTHDVLLSPNWNLIPEVYKILNMNLTKFIRKQNPKKYKEGVRILRRYPTYIVVRDIIALFNLGKYVYDNPEYMRKENKYIPHDCFWMFEREYFPEAYDGTLYKKLFGLSPKELVEIYSNMTAGQVINYAKRRFANWTAAQTKAVFFREIG